MWSYGTLSLHGMISILISCPVLNYLMGNARFELAAYGSGGETCYFFVLAHFNSRSLMFIPSKQLHSQALSAFAYARHAFSAPMVLQVVLTDIAVTFASACSPFSWVGPVIGPLALRYARASSVHFSATDNVHDPALILCS